MKRVFTTVVMLMVLGSGTATAHSTEEIEEWDRDWNARLARLLEVEQAGGLTPDLLSSLVAEKADWEARHLWYYHPQPEPAQQLTSNGYTGNGVDSGMGSGNVEQWRPLVSAYFGGETDLALCIIEGESGGNPNAKNPSSSASGLFQILGSLWAPYFGISPEALFDPETNVSIAKQIRDQSGWGAWNVYTSGACG